MPLARALARPATALIVAVLVRAAWWMLCPNEPLSDQNIYHGGAESIARGLGFSYSNGDPIGYWPVGYSAALAIPYRLFGSSLAVAYGFNLALGLLLVWVTYRLGRELYGERAGWVAGWAAALYPSFVLYTTVVASENLYQPLLVLATLLAVLAQRREGAFKYLLACGLVSGLAALVRPTAFIFWVVFAVASLAYGRGLKSTLARTAAVAAMTFAISLPWAIRNLQEFGKFSFTPFNGGSVLWGGNHEGADGQWDLAQVLPRDPEGTSLPEHDAYRKRLAVDFIRRNPLDFARLAALRTYHTLRAETITADWNLVGIEKTFGSGAMRWLKLLTTTSYYAVLLGFGAALLRRLRTGSWRRGDLVVGAAIAICSVPFLVLLGMDRYHLPLIPFAMVFAATLAPRGQTAPHSTTAPVP